MKESPNYINHIVMVLDGSASMSGQESTVVKVGDIQVAELAESSKVLDQETRMTVYKFNDTVECVYFDKDVLRMPSIAGKYRTSGNTALIDATMQAISDLEKTNTLYGDHAFLIYVLTDGQENVSHKWTAAQLRDKLSRLPDNWTIACLVPNANGVHYAKGVGFSPNNIAVWDTTSSRGLEAAAEKIRKVTSNYMTMRSQGGRGTKEIFNLDIASVGKAVSQGALQIENPMNYQTLHVGTQVEEIRPFVQAQGLDYTTGCAFYQFTKNEHIQPQKKIAIRDKRTKNVYTGDAARQMLQLPDRKILVQPARHPDFDIFVQSTSVNRKLMPNTDVLVFV